MDSQKQSQVVPNYKMTDLYLALGITLLVVIITYLLTKKLKRSVNVVLLTGLSDSGKTAIFTKVIYNKSKSTVTSLKENEAHVEEFNLKLIDLPGSDSLRYRFWDQFKHKASHVVFIVDSTTIDDKIRELSEYLYILLSDSTLHKNKTHFTLACNKQDLDSAKEKNYIKSLIEDELNAIKATKKGQLGKTSNEEEEDYLTKLGSEKFTFDDLKVRVVEISVQDPKELIKIIH